MKKIWMMVSVLALANVAAVAALLGWLGMTGRLDTERVRAVRVMLAEPVSEQKAREADAQTQADQQAQEAAAAEASSKPAATAAERLAIQQLADEIVQQRVQLLDKQVKTLKAGLDRERRELNQRQAEFKAERDKFLAYRKRIEDMEKDAQFQKALDGYAKLKPADTKAIFQVLIDQGQTEQVVAYLNKMQTRIRAKVIKEFKDDDPKVAAILQERLRTFGLVAEDTGDHADDAPDAGPATTADGS